MKEDTLARLEEKFREFPRSRATGVPVSEIEEASKELEFPFPSDYAEFLEKYGGAEVGAYPIFGLRKAPSMGNTYSVVEVTKEFRTAGIPGEPDWLIVSEDHAGNSIGIARDGKVYTFDHDFRQTLKIADSFEAYLRKECLDLRE